jgi:hypothetical protein
MIPNRLKFDLHLSDLPARVESVSLDVLSFNLGARNGRCNNASNTGVKANGIYNRDIVQHCILWCASYNLRLCKENGTYDFSTYFARDYAYCKCSKDIYSSGGNVITIN